MKKMDSNRKKLSSFINDSAEKKKMKILTMMTKDDEQF